MVDALQPSRFWSTHACWLGGLRDEGAFTRQTELIGKDLFTSKGLVEANDIIVAGDQTRTN